MCLFRRLNNGPNIPHTLSFQRFTVHFAAGGQAKVFKVTLENNLIQYIESLEHMEQFHI